MGIRRPLIDRYGPTALVTGAASGIGRSFAERLAHEGFRLVLVDRHREGVDALRATLEPRARAEAEARIGDLTDTEFVSALAARCETDSIGLMIHAAGVSSMGRFLDLPLDALRREIDLHCHASLELTHAAGRAMRARGRGGIVLLSSNSAVLRSPYVSNYAATKSYTLTLAESLYEDLRHDGVDVLGLVPGMTSTALLEEARPNVGRASALITTPEAVVAGALEALGREPTYFPSAADRLAAALFARLLPRKLGLVLARRSMTYFFDHLRGA
jgi:uncharacterized protein